MTGAVRATVRSSVFSIHDMPVDISTSERTNVRLKGSHRALIDDNSGDSQKRNKETWDRGGVPLPVVEGHLYDGCINKQIDYASLVASVHDVQWLSNCESCSCCSYTLALQVAPAPGLLLLLLPLILMLPCLLSQYLLLELLIFPITAHAFPSLLPHQPSKCPITCNKLK